MPVGRFVLDVHGESRATWPAYDALCAALQIINHLQDCRPDYRNLDRVYIPLDALAASGAAVEALGDRRGAAGAAHLPAPPCRTHRAAAVARATSLPAQINDLRLALEISVIHTLADRLARLLMARDPLSERVHLDKPAVAALTIAGVLRGASRRAGRRLLAPSQKPRGA